MTNYLVYEWNGQIKWIEIMGCYFVDPIYIEEFKAMIGDSRPFDINANYL